MYLLESLAVDLSFLNQTHDLALSLKTTTKNIQLFTMYFKFSCTFLIKSSSLPFVWLGDL